MCFKIKFLIGLFFCYVGLFGQSNSSIVTYGERIVNLPIDTTKISNNDVKFAIIDQIKAMSKALYNTDELYVLKFSEAFSTFEPLPFLENDSNPNLKRVISKGIYFSDIKENENFHQLHAFDKWYIIKSNRDDLEWKITNEIKNIGIYLCYKAIAIEENHKKVKTEIVAWFTPSIPYSYGPKNYGGLPGLVLELIEKGHSFYAINIKLNKNEFIFNKPSKGEEVTINEFNNIGSKLFSQLREN